MNYTTNNFKQTQKLGGMVANWIILKRYPKKFRNINDEKAVVLALTGDIGSGKTTFLQGLAEGLGIKDKILSPTFVILKRFRIHPIKYRKAVISPRAKLFNRVKNKKSKFVNFYHIDCYRLKNEKDMMNLGFKEIIKDKRSIIAIEWAERIKKIIPKDAFEIKFKIGSGNSRKLVISK